MRWSLSVTTLHHHDESEHTTGGDDDGDDSDGLHSPGAGPDPVLLRVWGGAVQGPGGGGGPGGAGGQLDSGEDADLGPRQNIPRSVISYAATPKYHPFGFHSCFQSN